MKNQLNRPPEPGEDELLPVRPNREVPPGGPRVGLALGAGAARGLAHLAVLQEMEAAGIAIHAISGSSAGALVAAIYACGTDLHWAMRLGESLSWEHLVRVTVPRLGFLDAERLLQLVRLLTRNRSFEQTRIPLYILATDIENGQEVVLHEGNVAEAVRASVAIPGVFVPYRLGGRLLVDGGVLNRVPVQILRDVGMDVVIGVDVSTAAVPPVRVTNVLGVILQTIEIMEHEVFRHRSSGADILIRPDLEGLSAADFHQAAELYRRGREAARQAIPAIKALLEAGRGAKEQPSGPSQAVS
ncbi:MAG: patatin-like phospholipase family protein [Firmicutes bacterium]|nr:patatin-like phospholipase family protein [Bacillota bacterium]